MKLSSLLALVVAAISSALAVAVQEAPSACPSQCIATLVQCLDANREIEACNAKQCRLAKCSTCSACNTLTPRHAEPNSDDGEDWPGHSRGNTEFDPATSTFDWSLVTADDGGGPSCPKACVGNRLTCKRKGHNTAYCDEFECRHDMRGYCFGKCNWCRGQAPPKF